MGQMSGYSVASPAGGKLFGTAADGTTKNFPFDYIDTSVTPEMYALASDPDSTLSIQRAINTGRPVRFVGSYATSSELTIYASGQVLYSTSGATITLTATSSGGSTPNVIKAASKTSVQVVGLNLVACGYMSHIYDGAGVALDTCTNSSVRNCKISGHRGYGVMLKACNDSEVQGNLFVSSVVASSDSDSNVGGDIGILYSSNRNLVEGNRINSGNGVAIILQTLNDTDTCQDNVVSNNVISNARTYGICLYRVGTVTTVFAGNVVVGNRIDTVTGTILNTTTSSYTYGAGIYLQGAEGTLVEGNSVYNTHSGGVTFADTLALGAIGTVNQSDFSIIGNKIRAPGKDGIRIKDPQSVGASGKWGVVADNHIIDAGRHGVSIEQRNQMRIAGNTIINSTSSGVIFAPKSPSPATMSDIDITGNLVTLGTTGFSATYVDNCRVQGNRFEGQTSYGVFCTTATEIKVVENALNIPTGGTGAIYLASDVTGGLIKRNTVRGAIANGIYNRTAGVAIIDNDVSGPTTPYAGEYPLWRNLTADSATPAVGLHCNWKTANANPTAYTNFTGAQTGQQIIILVRDANTSFDFTGTNLKGNAGVDLTAASADMIRAVLESGAASWYCTVSRAS